MCPNLDHGLLLLLPTHKICGFMQLYAADMKKFL
jgi:hypothetical protein